MHKVAGTWPHEERREVSPCELPFSHTHGVFWGGEEGGWAGGTLGGDSRRLDLQGSTAHEDWEVRASRTKVTEGLADICGVVFGGGTLLSFKLLSPCLSSPYKLIYG